MKSIRWAVAAVLTVLLGLSTSAWAPVASAADEPVAYQVGCGYVDFTNVSSTEVVIFYGDPRRVNDGLFLLEVGAHERVSTSRAGFLFGVFDAADPDPDADPIQVSDILYPQDCPTVKGATAKPVGTARVGKLLTVDTSGWTADAAFTSVWYRSGKKTGVTGPTYLLTKADKGKKITVKVTGSLDGYFSVTKTSKATAKVKAGLIASDVPTIEGLTSVGQTLTAVPNAWGPPGVGLTYQWYRNGKAIRKATNPTYDLLFADGDKRISVKVTGKLAGYTTVSKTSARTPKITVIG